MRGLNYFYQEIELREKTLDALLMVMCNLPDDGGVTLIVTHYVIISAIIGIGIGVASGEAVAFEPTTGFATKLDLEC